jgi:SAM-dependent MidA family methyltransferase
VAEEEGLEVLGLTDQSHFLLGLGALNETDSGTDPDGVEAVRHRLALKTLLVPGGLGSTHKVMLLGKQVGTPALRGCSFNPRTAESHA